MKLGKHSYTYIVVWYNTDKEELVNVPVFGGDESNLLNILIWKGPHQQLKNIFKVDPVGNVTKFKDLQFENKGLINKIKELTEK